MKIYDSRLFFLAGFLSLGMYINSGFAQEINVVEEKPKSANYDKKLIELKLEERKKLPARVELTQEIVDAMTKSQPIDTGDLVVAEQVQTDAGKDEAIKVVYLSDLPRPEITNRTDSFIFKDRTERNNTIRGLPNSLESSDLRSNVEALLKKMGNK